MLFIPELNQFLRRGGNLPTLPEVVLELQAALDDELSCDREIARIIDRDPALASRLLRVANSAFFNLGDRVGSVLAATQRLGVNRVRSLCIVLEIVKWSTQRDGALDHREFWAHSAAVGLAAQHLSQESGLRSPVDVGDVYMAGLLHDVGLLVLDQFFPERVGEVLDVGKDRDLPLWKLEAMVLGMDHGEIGGLLLDSWSLPRILTAIVTNHHHPHTSPDEFRMACDIVQAAEILCSNCEMGVTIEGPAGEDTTEILTSLGLEFADVESVIAETSTIRDQARDLFLAA